MSSAQIWEQIIQQIAQLQQSLQAYQQAVKLEHEEMSQCDKFDQDALHLLEFTALNAGESAHVMKQWRENRLYRRQLKQQIHFSILSGNGWRRV